MKWLMRLVVGVSSLLAIALGIAIAQPTKIPPAPMASVNAPFSNVDFSKLPAMEVHTARDREEISYRRYLSDSEARVALLLHGSSSRGASMHPLAVALAEDGITSYTIDIRGHGETGRRGDVDHIGQPSEDIEDMLNLIASKHPGMPVSLVGFSAGGGLALNAAGLGHSEGIEKLVLLSPMLGPNELPYTTKNPHKSEDSWATVNLPRIIGLSILNNFRIHAFDDLKVISFAVGDIEGLTGQYSHRLLLSMNPHDTPALLKAVSAPIVLIAGEKDELFAASAFDDAVHPVRPEATVTLIPEINHIELILSPIAHNVISDAILKEAH